MQTMTRKAYPTDLTDDQWPILEQLVPPAKHGGRSRELNMRVAGNCAPRVILRAFGKLKVEGERA